MRIVKKRILSALLVLMTMLTLLPTTALAAKGYILQSEVSVREPSHEPTPTLLEQFLEEHAPGGLNRYTFDIRA